jgi:hypothetical protein
MGQGNEKEVNMKTKRKFIQDYLEETGVSDQFRRKLYTCLPCHCGHPWCQGWVHVSNNPEKIEHHWESFVNQPEDGEIEGLGDDTIEGLDDDMIEGLGDNMIEGLGDNMIEGL